MLVKCPYCGREDNLSPLPETNDNFCCANPACGRVFSPDQPAGGSHQDAARALAMDYFADIPVEEPPKPPEPPAPEPEPEQHLSEAEKAQREELIRYAQEAAEAKAKAEESPEWLNKPQKRFIRETLKQKIVFYILLFFLVALPLIRIVVTRMTASLEQFSLMQPQIIPSLMYFAAAVILLSRLLRRTSKPQWIAAGLLLLPLALDFWYLIPGLTGILYPDLWLSIGGTVKILIAVFALYMSVRARKYPAMRYKEAEITHEHAE